MVNLDAKDKKLLFEIDFNARKTYSELAKKLLMSKRGIEYKLRNLEEKKVISRYYPVFNLSKLGYYYFRVFIKFNNLTTDLKEKIEHFILKEKDIGWAFWANGDFHIGIAIWAKTVSEFKKIANKIYFHFDQYIKDRFESVATSVEFFKNRYLTQNHEIESFMIKEKEESQILDYLDKALLKEMIKNPLIKIVDLADKLKESPQKTSYRLKRIEQSKILLGIRPELNYKLLNKLYYKLFIDLNNISEQKIKELEIFIKKNEKIVYLVNALGICDLDIELIVDSPEDIFSFIEIIQEHFPGIVKGYRSLIFGKMIKADFLPGEI